MSSVEDPERAVVATHRPPPYLWLPAVVLALLPAMAAIGPIEDIDSYWHILVGQDIASGIPVAEAGRGWDFTPVPDTWISTQWLIELLFARLEAVVGLDGLIAYRAVMSVVIVLVLAATTLRRRPARVAVWVFVLISFVLAMTIQARSLLVTYALAPLVGWWADRLWRTGRLPRWWIVLPLMVLWANAHGGWLLLPLALTLASVARALDHGARDPAVLRGLLLAAGSVAVTVISPAGLGTTLAAFRFSAATESITEWKTVDLWDWKALPLIAMLLMAVVAWSRGRVRPSKGELVLVLGLFGFAMTAWRSMPVACLTLGPILVGTLARGAGLEPELPVGAEPERGRRVLLAGAIVGGVLAVTLPWFQQPVASDVPSHLIADVAEATAPQRVLNAYNIAGPLLWFGGRPPHVRVSIDGRADRWGADWITTMGDVVNARPGWEATFDELDPTSAILADYHALGPILVGQRGWVEVAREGQYVLLRAPDAPGWS